MPVLVPIPVQVKISCQRRCRCSYRSAVAGADLNPLLVPERLSVQDNYVTYVRIQEQVWLYRTFRCLHWGACEAYRRVRAETQYWIDVVIKLNPDGLLRVKEFLAVWIPDGSPVPLPRPKYRVCRDAFFKAMRLFHQFGQGRNVVPWAVRRGPEVSF